MTSGNWKLVPVLKQKLTRFCTLGFVCAPTLLMPALIQAQDWQVQVGAQSHDKGRQVIAFLPNEVWIHAGDSVAFTVATDEPHTVTFLTPEPGATAFSGWLSGHHAERQRGRWIDLRE